jgi:hypothetical protein
MFSRVTTREEERGTGEQRTGHHSPTMSNNDEKEIFDFLDSLPSEDSVPEKANASASGNANADVDANTKDGNHESKTAKDDDILEFLDELEETNKKQKPQVEEKEKATAPVVSATAVQAPTAPVVDAEEQRADVREEDNAAVADPITSIASWWSNKGSAQVSSQLSSLWGTAQSLGEDAIKLAREQDIESNLKSAFKELGITGIQDEINNKLSEEQRGELMKLSVPDAKKAIESLNSGINRGMAVVGGTLNEVIDRFNAMNQRDEMIEIRLVHDMKNYLGLTNTIKNSFEDVMTQQVDGNIDVSVVESGTARTDLANGSSVLDAFNLQRINLALFNGKGTDAEKLVLANIENEIRSQTKKETQTQSNAESNSELELDSESVRKSVLYMGLLAWTPKTTSGGSSGSDGHGKDVTIDAHSPTSFTVTCVLRDPAHDISISAHSQPLPLQWANWIEEGNTGEAETGADKDKDKDEKVEVEDEEDDVDPGEWVIGWVHSAVANVIGVVSQTYVIKRMGY